MNKVQLSIAWVIAIMLSMISVVYGMTYYG